MCRNSAAIWQSSFIWHAGVFKRIRISYFWFQHINPQSFLYIIWKFGEIQISDPGVLDVRICTVGFEYFTGMTSYVHDGAGLLGTAVISNGVYFIGIR